jgi:hypothetical protein
MFVYAVAIDNEADIYGRSRTTLSHIIQRFILVSHRLSY